MENASKALILAASVLISIMLVSLGIFVFRTVSDIATDTSKLTDLEIANFNKQFTSYENENVRGIQVNELIKSVINSNINSSIEETGTYVTIQYPAVNDSIVQLGVNNNKTSASVYPSTGGVSSVDSLSNPLNGNKTYNDVIKVVKTNKTYKVSIHKNGSGLVDKILVE